MWEIEYDNDTGPNDEGFWETWTVHNGKWYFETSDEEAAKWLCAVLNNQAMTVSPSADDDPASASTRRPDR